MKTGIRWSALGALLIGLGCGILIWSDQIAPTPRAPVTASTAVRNVPTPPPEPQKALSKDDRKKLLAELPEAQLADELNAPGGTLKADMAILASLFVAYRSIYNGQGNPIGDNREITATFLGRGLNRNEIPFLKPGHRAINERGELCDRWGTPLHFHAESGTKMEIRSAGPDRILRTADDAVIIP